MLCKVFPPGLRKTLSGTFIEEANNLRVINFDCIFHCLKLISRIYVKNMQMKFTIVGNNFPQNKHISQETLL